MIEYNPYHHHCAYVSDGRRCHYMGSMTDSTVGSETWWCRAHYELLQAGGIESARMGSLVVDQSRRDHPSPDWWSPEKQQAATEARTSRQATEWLEAKGHGRLPLETDREYADRLREVCRGMGMKIKLVTE